MTATIEAGHLVVRAHINKTGFDVQWTYSVQDDGSMHVFIELKKEGKEPKEINRFYEPASK